MRISASLLLCQLTFRLASTQSCNVGSKCKSQEECPQFLEQRKELKKLQDSGDNEGYQVLLKGLQGKVCDGPQKKVCCGECGFTSTDPSFIVGGTDSYRGEFPFMALIGREVLLTRQCLATGCKDIFEQRWDCGGNIINRNFLLTAAHCKPKEDTFLVRLGEHKLEGFGSDDPDVTDQKIPLENFIVHEDYESEKPPFLNDIALIRLTSPVKTSRVVQVVCLPMEALGDQLEQGVVVGWGKTSNDQTSISQLTGAYSSTQQKLEVPIFADCPRGRVDPTRQICAGGEDGKDSCNGDSGGPLYWKSDLEDKDEPWFLIGVVSFGSRKCGSGRPAVYTRVSAYHEWINRKMEEFK